MSNRNPENITCSNCKKDREFVEMFSCKHIFCPKCIKKYYAKELKDGKYFEMKCLKEDCPGNSSFFHIIEFLSEKSLQSYKKDNCKKCQNKIIPLFLDCEHEHCPKCFGKEIRKSLKSNVWPCCEISQCKSRLKKKDLLLLGLSKKYLNIFQNLLSNEENKKNINDIENIFCSICYSYKTKENFRKLNCNHEFCINCLNSAILLKINSNESEIICPSQGCGIAINYYLIKSFINEENFEKYDQLLLKSLFLENCKAKEKKIPCPKCNISFFIWEDSSYFCCPKCKKTYCSNENCLGDWNFHAGKNCKEYFNENSDKNEKLFIDYRKKEKIAQCPKCRTVIEKIKGCNYIRCESNICQKKTLFCYLCGELLKDIHLKEHFFDQNIFGECIRQQNEKKNEEISINHKNEGKDKKNIEKKKNFNEKCWFCEMNELDLQENISEKIAICRSSLCKNRIVCLICKLAMKEKDVLEHTETQCVSFSDDDLLCNLCNCSDRGLLKIDTLTFQCQKCLNTFCLKCKMNLQKNIEEDHFENCYYTSTANFNFFPKIFSFFSKTEKKTLFCSICNNSKEDNFEKIETFFFKCKTCQNTIICQHCKNLILENEFEDHLQKCFQEDCRNDCKLEWEILHPVKCKMCHNEKQTDYIIEENVFICKNCENNMYCKYCSSLIEDKNFENHRLVCKK